MLTSFLRQPSQLALAVGLLVLQVAFGDALLADDPKASSDTSSSEVQIAQLIEQLGHDNFRMRVNAQQALDKIGLPAYEQLRKALDHSNIQISRSAEYLLRSQNVSWWLESDSHEVRTRLLDYSSLDTNNRQTRLLELANLGTDDALLALARIAKFENNELCSRSSALELLKRLASAEDSRRLILAQSILLTLGKANRSSTRWLEAYSNQIVGLQPFDLAQWTGFADQLSEDLNRSRASLSSGPGQPEHLFKQQKLQVLKFYEWLVSWVQRDQDRTQALAVAMKSTQLAMENLHAVHEYSTWALSVDLPELVVELFGKIDAEIAANGNRQQNRPKVARSLVDTEDQQLIYLLAEAHRKLGDEVKANEYAVLARKVPVKKTALMGQLAKNNVPEIQAIQRLNQSRTLKDRGQFDWAEEELKEAIGLESRSELGIRLQLAELYREGRQFSLAAEVLQKIVQSPPPADRNLPLSDDYAFMLASYHWYRALDELEKGNRDLGLQELKIACEQNEESEEPNPDIIITLYRNAKTADEKTFFRTQFNKLVDKYRADVAESESTLTHAVSGLNSTQQLAESCNQLAWLLACCETNIEEAIYLSGRSLEFDSEVHTYLDTMARCQFAAGQFEQALDYQTRAVAGSPNSRTMKAQLQEIQAAWERSKQK